MTSPRCTRFDGDFPALLRRAIGLSPRNLAQKMWMKQVHKSVTPWPRPRRPEEDC